MSGKTNWVVVCPPNGLKMIRYRHRPEPRRHVDSAGAVGPIAVVVAPVEEEVRTGM